MSESIVYFLRRESDGAIKIGITTNLRQRMADLRRSHGTLTLLGMVEGAATREKLAHLIFADVRLDGEFFQVTPAITAFMDQYATPSPPAPVTVAGEKATDGRFVNTTGERPWVDQYSDPLVVYSRDEFVRDYEDWIARGLVSTNKRAVVAIFRGFPERIKFVPQPGLHGWGWTPLNARCWTDESGRRLYAG
jgi:hypothetical protein